MFDFPSCCHIESTLEVRNFDIFWKIDLHQSVRIHKENLDCKWLMIMSRLTDHRVGK